MANSYLNRTPSSAGNRRTWTWSGWVKRNTNASGFHALFEAGRGTNPFFVFSFYEDGINVAQTAGVSADWNSTRKFRDTNGFYHVMLVVDTTSATSTMNGSSTDRMRVYVNNEQVVLSGGSVPSQNADLQVNQAIQHNIGGYNAISNMFDGYMSHVAFVDGQALAPTVFGQTDSTSGIWKFKQPSGVTWGTNGFWLKFENSGALGTDSSGNTNTFTVNGDGRQALDTPSNVYATMNSLDQNGGMTFSEGNLSVASTSASWRSTRGTLGVTQGKWYYEVKVTNVSGANLDMMVGWGDFEIAIPSEFSSSNPALTYTAGSGNKQLNGVNSSYGDSYNINDIIGVAFDADNLTVEFFKNGTSQGSISTGWSSGITWTPVIAVYGRYNNTKASANFGNGYFGTTAITSAGSNGNGSLFEYDVPSGYYALNTKNINTYG